MPNSTKPMKVTVITKYDGTSGDIYVAVVSTPLNEITAEKRLELRRDLDCDGAGDTDEDDCETSNLFFQEVTVTSIDDLNEILNADGEDSE